MSEEKRGAAAALAAYFIWGMFSLYFKALAAVPAEEVLAHRITGCAVFALAVLALAGRLGSVWAVIADRRLVRTLFASAVAVSINWGLFVWAVAHARALEASMGYFIFPLVSMLLARIVLGERLNRRRQVAAAVVAAGVAWLVLRGEGFPWVALTLATSFGTYGLLRKTTPVPALTGLLIETALVAPPAMLYLMSQQGGVGFGLGAETASLLLLAGPATAIPLWLFAYGARRLALSTLGLMMYVNPTVQMLVAVFVFGEAFTAVHAVAFTTIWVGLALYSWPEPRAALA